MRIGTARRPSALTVPAPIPSMGLRVSVDSRYCSERQTEVIMQLARPSRLFSIGGLIAVIVLNGAIALRAQDEQRRTKVPLIGKVTGGSNRQAFSGKVQKVDIKRKLLVVDTVEGSSTEYFPVKK